METNEKRIVFMSGRLVNLRPLRKSTDLESALRWINDPEIRYFLKATFPVTEAGEAAFFDGIEKKDDTASFAIETKDGTFIGVIGLHKIDFKNGTAMTGALIGEKEYWGKGYGTDAKMLVLEYAFNELGLRKVCSHAYEFNERSIAYSMHCGYKTEGRLRKQVFKRGRHWDVVVLGVLRDEWIPIWRRYRSTGRTHASLRDVQLPPSAVR